MEDNKVSIIVPVYAVEQYIEECLISIKNQTYHNIEIILIDDESPDSCGRICDEFALDDERFLVIHQKNTGAAGARNAGLDIATGSYITFVDSDDVIEDTFIETLLTHLVNSGADVSVCGYQTMYKDKACPFHFNNLKKIYSKEEYLVNFVKDYSCALIWNKLFKKSVISDIRFERGHQIDDEFFTYKLIMNADKIVQTDKLLYKYRIRKQSLMNNPLKAKMRFYDQIDFIDKRYENIKEHMPQIKDEFLEHMADNFIQFFRRSNIDKELIDKIKECITKYKKDFISGSYNKVLKFYIFKYMMMSPQKIITKRDRVSNTVNDQDDMFD